MDANKSFSRFLGRLVMAFIFAVTVFACVRVVILRSNDPGIECLDVPVIYQTEFASSDLPYGRITLSKHLSCLSLSRTLPASPQEILLASEIEVRVDDPAADCRYPSHAGSCVKKYKDSSYTLHLSSKIDMECALREQLSQVALDIYSDSEKLDHRLGIQYSACEKR